MRDILPIFRRELLSYFITPLAYVFIVIFLLIMGAFTFYFGGFYQGNTAHLGAFFTYHPWLYLFLIPAISMRLWAEEQKTGTIELLLTLPVPLWALVVGKYLAAWAFAGIALMLTFPIWITVNVLGDPDNGVIAASYLGSFLMAGAYLAIGACISATTNNQVIAFVISVVVCFLFTVAGLPIVTGVIGAALPPVLAETVTSFSFLTHFNDIALGVIDLRDIVFFLSLIVLWLTANTMLVGLKRMG